MPLHRELLSRLGIRPRSRPRSSQPAVPTVSSTIEAPPVVAETQNPVFDAAVDDFTKRLTDEERSAFNKAHTGITAEQLFERVAKLDAMDKKTKTRKSLETVSSFLGLLNQLVNGIAIGIQASPEISSLVVGGAKLIIDMAVNFVDFFQQLTVMIQRLSDHLGHLGKFSNHIDNQLIIESVQNVYGGLLDFYHHAYKVFKDESGQSRSHPHLRSGIQAQWKPFKEEFGNINLKIEHYLKILEHSANVATLDAVVSLHKRGEKEIEDRERREVLQWLSATDFDSIQSSTLSKRWPETGSWLLDHESFTRWLADQDGPCLLWCNGGPGTGKSVLSSIIIDHIERRLVNHPQDSRLVYAYCDYQDLGKNQTEAIVASLAKQLIRSHEAIPDVVTQAFRKHKGQDKKPVLETTTGLFCEVARQLPELFIVVDALDECNDEDRERFLGYFIHEVLRTVPYAKVLITSRPETSISDYLHNLSVCEITIGVAKTKGDISKYIRGKLDISSPPTTGSGEGLQRTHRIRDPQLRDEIINKLDTQSEGMFLWVDLQIKQIFRQRNDSDRRDVLMELPKGLNNTYIRILHQAEQESESLFTLVKKCLMWITHARRTLRLYELRDAVITDYKFKNMTGLKKHRKKYTMADIMDACRGLLVSEDKHDRNHLGGWAFVRPVHFSLVEFLMTDLSVARSKFTLVQNPGAVEFELAQACLHHLRHLCLTEGPASTFDELRLRLSGSDRPFAWYCARFFDDHAAGATEQETLKQSLEDLLTMDEWCLAALSQLRHMRRPTLEVDFLDFNWDVNSRTIVETSCLVNIPSIRDDNRWKTLAPHPNSLYQACADGNSRQANYLIGLGLDPDMLDSSGETPFQVAVFRQHLDVVELLLQAGANVNQPCSDDGTAVELISVLEDVPLVTLLLKYGAKGVEDDCTFSAALDSAVWHNCEKTAHLLLSHGAKPTESILHDAVEYGMAEVVDACLRSGADPNHRVHREAKPEQRPLNVPRAQPLISKPLIDGLDTGKFTTPLYCASKWGWTDVVRVLLDHGADVNLVGGSIGTPLQAAALGGRLGIVQLLLNHGAVASVNQVVGSHGTALSAAAFNGHDHVVRALLDAGADVNTVGGEFGCALVASVEFDETTDFSKNLHTLGTLFVPLAPTLTIDVGEQNVTQQLIAAGANLSDQGSAALIKAAGKGHRRLVDLLLAHGAPFDSTALDEAIWTEHADVARIATRHGADPNKLDKKGRSPLIKAVNLGDGDLVHVLIEEGADPNLSAIGDSGPWSWRMTRCLHVACTHGDISMVKILLENHADPNLPGTIDAANKGEGGYNGVEGYGGGPGQGRALHAACIGGALKRRGNYKSQHVARADVVTLLLEYGARIDEVDERGWTALELACSRRYPDPDAYKIASTLVNAGADISASSSTHSGPLEAAARHGFLDIVDLLLSRGVDSETQKQSALQVAAEDGHEEIVSILLNAGVDVEVPLGSTKFVRESDKPIHSAARWGRYSMAKKLIDAGAKINEQGYHGTVYETALVGLPCHVRSGGWAELIRLLQSMGAEEPSATCHYGVLCNGPKCAGPGTSSISRRGQRRNAKPSDWIRGTRFECRVCEAFNLCSGCNDIFVGHEEGTTVNKDRPSTIDSCSSDHSSDTSDEDEPTERYLIQHKPRHETKRFDIRESLGPEEEPGTGLAHWRDIRFIEADALSVEVLELGLLWTG